MAQLIQGLPIAAFVIDSQHRITYCNRAFEKLTGLSTKSLIGTSNQWRAFYPSARPTLADLIADEAPESEITERYGGKYRRSPLIEGAYEVEDYFPSLSERGKWLFFTASPLRDQNGKVSGAIETLQDITDRKLAEKALKKSERRLRALLDFVPYPAVVFTLDGLVNYLNPAFTEIFGWTLEELEGKKIPYVPPGLKQETDENIRRLMSDRVIMRYEAQRLTKSGRLLDVVIRAAVFSINREEPAGQIVILRDISKEKRNARVNEAMHRISLALPLHPFLEELLDYVNEEVKQLLNSEGAITILHDEERRELYFPGAAYDQADTGKRVKEIRFPLGELMAGKVIQTGQPLILSDTSADRAIHEARDKKLGYQTRNLLLVPLRTVGRIIGALCAINKKEGDFDQDDEELLSIMAGTVALSIENARVTEELQKAYREVSRLNRAKDKTINHLSHELITPAAILSSSVRLLSLKLGALPEGQWKPAIDRIQRNLDRILQIQYELGDIMSDRPRFTHKLLSFLLDQCTEMLGATAAEVTGEENLVAAIKKRIDVLYGPGGAVPQILRLDLLVAERLEALRPLFSQRILEISTFLEPDIEISLPPEIFPKIFDGLVRNAVENTPDEGAIEIAVHRQGDGVLLEIRDFGQGITPETRHRIFEGFFPNRDIMNYSSRRRYEFNAGGQGADLLRMKILAERYGFKISMTSRRCSHIPRESDLCPGRIRNCPFCREPGDCRRSGGSTVSVYFPSPPTLPKPEAEGD